MPVRLSNLLSKLSVDEGELPSLTPPCTPCSPLAPTGLHPLLSPTARGDFSSFVFQPNGQPKQAMIDGEIWPPIFKSEFVRLDLALLQITQIEITAIQVCKENGPAEQ